MGVQTVNSRHRQLRSCVTTACSLSQRPQLTDGHHVGSSNREWGPGNTGATSFRNKFSSDLIFKAFGGGSAIDVFELLTSQLSS